MKTLNPRIERLKQMMALEEQRAVLQQELDSLSETMSALNEGLFDDSSPAKTAFAPSTKAPAPVKGPRSKKARTQRHPRGALRAQIMAALEAAGSAGVKVKELAQAIGIKPVNVHSWFHSALKKTDTISKLNGGHYRLKGSGATATKAKPAKAGRPAKQTKPTVKVSRRGGAKRGELTTQIVAALKDAGAAGISVADLATQLKAKYKNIYIWFATTGKKHKGLKKVGPARYSLEG